LIIGFDYQVDLCQWDPEYCDGYIKLSQGGKCAQRDKSNTWSAALGLLRLDDSSSVEIAFRITNSGSEFILVGLAYEMVELNFGLTGNPCNLATIVLKQSAYL
jgi:hypothetical protein